MQGSARQAIEVDLNQCRRWQLCLNPPQMHFGGSVVTQGELLYLLLTLASFGVFMAVLAYFGGVAHMPQRRAVPVKRQPAGSHAHAR
jgi:hypothetical protein